MTVRRLTYSGEAFLRAMLPGTESEVWIERVNATPNLPPRVEFPATLTSPGLGTLAAHLGPQDAERHATRVHTDAQRFSESREQQVARVVFRSGPAPRVISPTQARAIRQREREQAAERQRRRRARLREGAQRAETP